MPHPACRFACVVAQLTVLASPVADPQGLVLGYATTAPGVIAEPCSPGSSPSSPG